MGITKVTWDALQEVYAEFDKEGIGRVVELGDQEFVLPGKLNYNSLELRFSKHWYELQGIPHMYIDIHGGNGSLSVNMDLPLPAGLYNRADTLTNIGFAEHVDLQYQCWKNIHDLTNYKGIMIHELPGQANFPGHKKFPWYQPAFFAALAGVMRYTVITNKVHWHDFEPMQGNCVFAVMMKEKVIDFIDPDEFKELPGLNRN